MCCWKNSRATGDVFAEPPPCPAAVSAETIKEIFGRAKQMQDKVGGTAGAELAHTSLPAEHWGLSRLQLLELATQLHKMMETGDLTNRSRMECRQRRIPYYDEEKFQDVDIGPTMHQVNAGYIQPTTLQKDAAHGIPCLSYALHQNAYGLRCDLFISHAWSEGVFELCHTVDRSWPLQCVGAYICSMANPQNLPELMSHLIQTPRESPFFRVLTTRPREMLMVANSNVPIHSRLWCVYEAHCAKLLKISMSVVGDPAHFATNASASQSALHAIRGAVEAKRRELAIAAASEDAAMDMDIIAAGVYHRRLQRWEKRAQRQTAAAIERMKRALDVRKAKCSSPEDGAAILGEIGHDVEEINAMLCSLILQDQLQRVPSPGASGDRVKLTWYPGQDMVEGLAVMFGC